MRERRKLPSVATSNLNLLFTLIPGPTRAGCYPNQDTGQDGLRHPPFAVSMPARIDGNHPICPRVTSKREPRQAFNQIPRCHDVDDVAAAHVWRIGSLPEYDDRVPFIGHFVCTRGGELGQRPRNKLKSSSALTAASGAPLQKKSPAFRRGLLYLLTNPASDPDRGASVPDDSGSASRGPDPAAAVRASGRRHLAADRASDPGSGSAGPDCSDWSLRVLRCLDVDRTNGDRAHSLRGNTGSAAIIPRQARVRTVAPEPAAQKLALYKPIKPHLALLPPPVPTC